MAQAIKITTTKPLPEGVELVTRAGKLVFPIKRGGKTIFCPVTECKTKYRVESRKWYAQFRSEDGTVKRKPAFTDKEASLKFANDLEAKAVRHRMGLAGSTESIFELAVPTLIKRFEKYLRAKNNTETHCTQTIHRVSKMFEGANVQVWGQITPGRIMGWLAEQREQKEFGVKTSNYYLIAAKTFCNWVIEEGIAAANPLRAAKPLNAEGDVRRKRRAMDVEEFERLIWAAREGKPVQSVGGEERAILYIVAAWTGFRRSELASLTGNQLRLEGPNPSIIVDAAYSKRRREDSIPLHPLVAEELAKWLVANPRGAKQPVFSLRSSNGYTRATSKMMAADLASARSKWISEASDDKERLERTQSDFLSYQSDDSVFADFHSNRHTFITNLGKAGIAPKMAQTLARHSDIRLTFNVYSHVEEKEQSQAVGLLNAPPIRPVASSTQDTKTGGTVDKTAIRTESGLTDSSSVDSKSKAAPLDSEPTPMDASAVKIVDAEELKQDVKIEEVPNPFALQFALAHGGGCHLGTDHGSETPEGVVAGTLPQTLDLSGFSGDCQSMTDKIESSPGWARTTDTRINSPAYFAILRGKTQYMRKLLLRPGA